jgi:hypothetical protein
MKAITTAVLGCAAAFGMAQGWVIPPGQPVQPLTPTQQQQMVMGGFGMDSPYNQLWSAETPVALNGTVRGRLVAPPMDGMQNAVILTVSHPDRTPWEVHLGPAWFINNIGLQVETGDEILVSGSRVQLGERTIVLAETVTRNGTETFLRDRNGVPLWIAHRTMTQPIFLGPGQHIEGEIISSSLVVLDGVTYVAYQVDTGMGVVDVVAAPAWYMNQQALPLQFGDTVSVFASGPARPVWPTVTIANSIWANDTMFFMRSPNGIGIWNAPPAWW